MDRVFPLLPNRYDGLDRRCPVTAEYPGALAHALQVAVRGERI
jgi:hypothetical protein